MTLHFGMDSEFENTQDLCEKKNTGAIWEQSSYLHMAHMLHTNTQAHFQVNLKGYLALSSHCTQFCLTQHSLQAGHCYLHTAVLFLGFV